MKFIVGFIANFRQIGNENEFGMDIGSHNWQVSFKLSSQEAEIIQKRISDGLGQPPLIQTREEEGEILEISRVMPRYGRKFSELELRFTTMAKTMFTPGMKVKVIPVTQSCTSDQLPREGEARAMPRNAAE